VPGAILLISTSTGAPAALARSLGVMLLINGTATAAHPRAPTADVAIKNLRFSTSTCEACSVAELGTCSLLCLSNMFSSLTKIDELDMKRHLFGASINLLLTKLLENNDAK
jgi:hypothetical protein